MDKIFLRDLRVETVIGVAPGERNSPHELVLNIELRVDLIPAGVSDDLRLSVDYFNLAEKLAELGKKSTFFLIEAFAEAAAKVCLADFRVESVKVMVDKSGCVPAARSAAVEIERFRG
ncbi:MAG: dihydroneopterin aldolase [Victivallaceae bacterium]|nr:dihydroneopterin aldolase [Victivallaceae bacterium]